MAAWDRGRMDIVIWRTISFHTGLMNNAKIAILGIPAKVIPMDWRLVIFNMLTIKGIYGREVYETWYKMTVMLEYLVCRLLTTI